MGRISEFAKSNRKEDPKEDLEDNTKRNLRGLHFKVTTNYSMFRIATNNEFQDIYIFIIFNKEKKKIELYIRLIKDKKGKGDNPQDR